LSENSISIVSPRCKSGGGNRRRASGTPAGRYHEGVSGPLLGGDEARQAVQDAQGRLLIDGAQTGLINNVHRSSSSHSGEGETARRRQLACFQTLTANAPSENRQAGLQSQKLCKFLRFRMSHLRRTPCKTLAPSRYTHRGKHPAAEPTRHTNGFVRAKSRRLALFVQKPQPAARGNRPNFRIFASPSVRFSYDARPTAPINRHRPRRKIPFLQNDTGIRNFASPSRPPGSALPTPTTSRVFASPSTNTLAAPFFEPPTRHGNRVNLGWNKRGTARSVNPNKTVI
jgi:hypothetical protein